MDDAPDDLTLAPSSRMKPRIFLGSSGKQTELVQALTVGLQEVAEVVPWNAAFPPSVSTLDRLVELTGDVDFAAFFFAQDDWTSNPSEAGAAGEASPRDNVVFEAGLFGGALGMRRAFILHAKGAKLPTDLDGLTTVRYPENPRAADIDEMTAKLRKAIEDEGNLTRLDGDWWQHTLTLRTERDPGVISLLRITRDPEGEIDVAGRAWKQDGTISARYWSKASKERRDPPGVFYFWEGERPREPNAPTFEGTGEIRLESADRASGWFTTRSESDAGVHERTAAIYLRADPADMGILDGGEAQARADLLARRLAEWRAISNT